MEKLTINQDILDYISNHSNISFTELLENEKEGKELQIPIIEKETGRFLYMLVQLHRPKKILEIGFGGGQSAFWMAKALSENGHILSLDTNKQRVERGHSLIKKYGFENKIEVRFEDAHKYLAECKVQKETFDFIFLDAIKRSYIKYLPNINPVLADGGVFIVDNVFFRGMVVQKVVEKKYKDGVNLLKSFNDALVKENNFDVQFLPIGDGIALCIKKKML